MTYKPSPRPTFNEPTAIPYAAATRHLWGDPEAGEVADWIYVSSDRIHQLVYGLPPGGAFRHSQTHRTIFAADVVYYVLSGCMVICNPATGEVHPVHPGQAAFFRRDTWHHVINHSLEPLRVLEFLAPPPSQGTAGTYARQQPYLEQAYYEQANLLGTFPMATGTSSTIHVARDENLLWRLEGDQQQILTGLIIATQHLLVAKASLLPGGSPTAPDTHTSDESLYVTEGTLHIHLPEFEGQKWHELHPGDGFYLPAGTPHRYANMGGTPVRWVYGIAPGVSDATERGVRNG